MDSGSGRRRSGVDARSRRHCPWRHAAARPRGIFLAAAPVSRAPRLSARAFAMRPAPREFNKKAETDPHVLPVLTLSAAIGEANVAAESRRTRRPDLLEPLVCRQRFPPYRAQGEDKGSVARAEAAGTRD